MTNEESERLKGKIAISWKIQKEYVLKPNVICLDCPN